MHIHCSQNKYWHIKPSCIIAAVESIKTAVQNRHKGKYYAAEECFCKRVFSEIAEKDKKLLKDSLPMMKKWVDYIGTQCEKPYIFERLPQYGDWLALDAPYGSYNGLTSFGLVGTAFYAYSTSLLIEALEAFNIDASEYKELYKNIKEAYRNEYLENGLPKGEKAYLNSNIGETPYTQTGIVLTLYF
ncbi:MAG: hypothetical protein IJN59_03180, partial [Oscillospiraceae bacterium]|nr:hypothetical protein [Oscillospiraceae bacterium]